MLTLRMLAAELKVFESVLYKYLIQLGGVPEKQFIDEKWQTVVTKEVADILRSKTKHHENGV
jgi:hypothetical protein